MLPFHLPYQVDSPGADTRSHLSQSLNQLLQTPKRVKRRERVMKNAGLGEVCVGGCFEAERTPAPTFPLHISPPPSIILSHYETDLEPGGVLFCPQFLFTHVLPLNIKCD